MVKIKQKAAAPEIDWTGIDAVIERESHPQLAKRLPALAGDNEGNLIAPGINRIYARIGDDTEATIVMYRVSQNADILQLHAPILVYWNKNENSYVYDGDDTGAYNQASGGGTPTTSSYLASYILQTSNAQLPNAQDLDSLTDNALLYKTSGGVVDDLAPGTSGNSIRSNGTLWTTVKNNIAATTAPTANDDSADGYAIGSWWLDVTNDKAYIAFDVTVASAIWIEQSKQGTVTSVALTVPSFLSVAGSPITSSGTLAVSLATQLQNLIFASPNGSTGVPTFRAIASADLTTALTTPPPIGGTTPNTIGGTTGQFDPNSNNRTEILIGGVQQTRAESSNLTQPNYHLLRRAGGSIASPSATQNTQVIARWEADSHSGSAYVTAGYLQYEATETHSGSNRGTKATIRTTQAGGTTTRDFVWKDYGAFNPPALSGAPSAPADGDIWTQDHKLGARQSGITTYFVTGDYTQTDFVSNSSSSAENTYVGSSQGAPNYPADFFNIGTALILEWSGILSLSPTSNTLTFRVKLGSTTIGTFSFTGSTNNVRFYVRLLITCVATGASSTIRATGYMLVNATIVHSGTTSLFNVNTANAQQFSCTIQCSSATGTVSTDQACLTRLK